MANDFDVIVVGGGAMGTATARNLAERGRRTLLLERFTFGHANGSSGGPTRIFRVMYHTPAYARMAMAARSAWDELQDAAGEPLLHITGGLDLGAAALLRADVVESVGAPVERLDAAGARERWPELRLRDEPGVVYQPDGGVLRASRTIQVQARLAETAGADVREHTTVSSIVPGSEEAAVVTDHGERFTAPVVVVSVGPWARGLLSTAGIDLPLRATLEQVSYFRLSADGASQAAGSPAAPFPTLIDWSWDEQQPPYMVPDPFEPEYGLFKVGLHHAGPDVDAETRTFDPDADRVTRVQAWVDEHIDGAVSLSRTDTCLYTFAPDEDFIMDRVGPLVVASPCSGHGFKFVPLFGRVIGDLATNIRPPLAMEAFAMDRAGLRASSRTR